MRCYTCHSDNPASSFYCSQCGSPVRSAAKLRSQSPSSRPTDRSLLIYGGMALIVLNFAFLIIFSNNSGEPQNGKNGSAPELAVTKAVAPAHPDTSRNLANLRQQGDVVTKSDFTTDDTVRSAHASASRKPAAAQPEPEPPPPLLIGSVTVLNPWGHLLAEVPAAVSRDGWVAMPMAAMLGGRTITFNGSAVGAINIDRGLWHGGDPVGLWRLDGEEPLKAMELNIWSDTLPFSWQSLQPGSVAVSVQVQPMDDLGLFVRCSLPSEITVPGVLLQGGRIVGWTFGAWDSSGYLWDGDTAAVRSTTNVSNYYRQTFQGGREEQFAMVLAMEEGTPLGSRIAALCDGFLRQPKLSPEMTPAHLRKETLSRYLVFLVKEAMQQGLEQQVAASLTLAVLKEADDPGLPGEVIKAVLAVAGHEEAIHIAAEMGKHFADRNQAEAQQLDTEEARLFLDYLRILRDDGNTRYGWRIWDEARRAFPGDPGIHLIGVDLALAEGNWQEAERLLYRFDYPPEFRDKAELLAARIAELKGQEGKIIIRFTPGSNVIPVEAVLNGRIRQRFLVDTGATFATIPKETFHALGLRMDRNSPPHRVTTAGGGIYAKSVTLGSIELGGWAVDNIPVLVLDIPDQPGLGLLGLNFLSRFKMELQTEKGVLMLSPR